MLDSEILIAMHLGRHMMQQSSESQICFDTTNI